MRSSNLLVLLSATPALSSILAPIEALHREFNALLPRQESQTSFDLSFTGQQGNTATTVTSTSGSQSGSATTTGSNSGSTSGTQSGSNQSSQSGTKTSQATTKTFDQRLPAGGVQMITPAPTAQASYYKIKEGYAVTFAWNYTSLSVTPSAVDVLASCSQNQQIYTISANMSITNATQSVTWDAGAYQATATIPLLTETYTLIIHDAASDISATAKAGYLGVYNQFTFGMYLPQQYTPIADWTCATCSAAMSSMERHTLGFVFLMALLTVMSFSWFGNVAGLL